MRTLNKTLKMLVFSTLIFSCDDILEDDITDDVVEIISPSEDLIINGNTVQFSWQVLDGADRYRIQIIKSNQVYEVDSLVTTNTFKYVLNSGNYQWRLRAENFAYISNYTFPIRFFVETSEDLTNQNVSLLTPSIDYYTNNPSLIFTWEKINSANTYSYELVKKLNGDQTILQQPDLTVNSYTIDPLKLDEDAEYIWKIKAVNSNSETVFSNRSIFIDRVSPNQPVLSSPNDQGTSTSKTVSFNWINGTDSGNLNSTITNMIEITNDTNFNNIMHSATTGNNTYQFTFSNSGTYYWRVKAKDKAGNESDYSVVRSITVQ